MDSTELTTKNRWSQIKLESVEFAIKFELEGEQQRSITCWLSDLASVWTECISSDDVLERFKKCNPLLSSNDIMGQIFSTISTIPQVENIVRLTRMDDDKEQHLSLKYYLSDGYDNIPLKFYWKLQKRCTKSFFEKFSKVMLLKIIDLEKTNDFLTKELAKSGRKRDTNTANGDEGDCENGVIPTGSLIDPSTSSFLQESFECDVCLQDIKGYRYRCIECDDFDLCAKCEHIEKHHSHHMVVRYAHPQDKARFNTIPPQKYGRANKRCRFTN